MRLQKTKKIRSGEPDILEVNRVLGLSYGASQTVGKREEQQDCFSIREFPDGNSLLAVVADGMGGLKHGAAMAQKAVSKMESALEQGLREQMSSEQVIDLLLKITEQTGKELAAWCKEQKAVAGSTLAAALLYGKELFFCTVGDSRIYLCRRDELLQVNEDHSLENYLLRYSLRQEEKPELYGSLYSYLGQDPVAEIDYSRKGLKLLPGDVLLLCTDGVYQAVTEDEILKGLSCGDMQKSAECLIRTILEKKMERQDNATVVMVRCAEE